MNIKTWMNPQKWPTHIIAAIEVAIVLLIIYVISHLFTVRDVSYEVGCAIISVVFGAVITMILLKGQSSADEKKDKDIKIHENKICVYSAFIEKMWKMIADDDLNDEEWSNLRTLTFGQLIFYLPTKHVEELTGFVEAIEKAKQENNYNAIKQGFANITNLLISDINDTKGIDAQQYVDLYNKYNVCAPETDETNSQMSEKNLEHEKAEMTETNLSIPIAERCDLNKDIWAHQCWHLCALSLDKQKELFNKEDDKYTLMLIEYGESWRTDAMKQMNEGDIIFLFAKGGGGYYGIFKAKNVTRTLQDGTEVSNPVFCWEKDNNHSDKFDDSLSFKDIYGGEEDGATLVTAVNIEPICYAENGIGNDKISPRRQTIIRLNQAADRQGLLEAFDEAVKSGRAKEQ